MIDGVPAAVLKQEHVHASTSTARNLIYCKYLRRACSWDGASMCLYAWAVVSPDLGSQTHCTAGTDRGGAWQGSCTWA